MPMPEKTDPRNEPQIKVTLLLSRRTAGDEAAAHHAEALELLLRVLPEGHPDLLRSMAALR